jgi:hypothetical protein
MMGLLLISVADAMPALETYFMRQGVAVMGIWAGQSIGS